MKPFCTSDSLRSRSRFASCVGDLRADDLRALRRGVALALQLRGARGLEVGLRLAHLELEGLGIDAREQLVAASPAS